MYLVLYIMYHVSPCVTIYHVTYTILVVETWEGIPSDAEFYKITYFIRLHRHIGIGALFRKNLEILRYALRIDRFMHLFVMYFYIIDI